MFRMCVCTRCVEANEHYVEHDVKRKAKHGIVSFRHTARTSTQHSQTPLLDIGLCVTRARLERKKRLNRGMCEPEHGNGASCNTFVNIVSTETAISCAAAGCCPGRVVALTMSFANVFLCISFLRQHEIIAWKRDLELHTNSLLVKISNLRR